VYIYGVQLPDAVIVVVGGFLTMAITDSLLYPILVAILLYCLFRKYKDRDPDFIYRFIIRLTTKKWLFVPRSKEIK
jgi:type IV secretory pathway VirB3-like protein